MAARRLTPTLVGIGLFTHHAFVVTIAAAGSFLILPLLLLQRFVVRFRRVVGLYVISRIDGRGQIIVMLAGHD